MVQKWGHGILNQYDNSVFKMLTAVYPELYWDSLDRNLQQNQEWYSQIHHVPRHYWDSLKINTKLFTSWPLHCTLQLYRVGHNYHVQLYWKWVVVLLFKNTIITFPRWLLLFIQSFTGMLYFLLSTIALLALSICLISESFTLLISLSFCTNGL